MILRGLLILVTTIILSACEEHSLENVEKLGTETFTPEKWQTASHQERARMVYSFLTIYKIEHLSAERIIDLLGPPTGYYEYDEFPAYLVGSDFEGDNHRLYLLAFPIDRTTGKARKYVFEKAD